MLRFGLKGNSLTLEQAGKEFDLTRERIRQIEEKAISRLRASEALKGLSEDLE